MWLLSVLLLLRFVPPPPTCFVLQAKRPCAMVHASIGGSQKQISANMLLTAIAAEDQRFRDHHGFDTEAIKAAFSDAEGGASTISQQVAKNLFLWPGRRFVRKGVEAWLTVLG